MILLYHFEVNFSSFFGSYHFSTDKVQKIFEYFIYPDFTKIVYTESDFPGTVPENSNMAPGQNAPEEPKKKKGLFSFMDKESSESVKKGLKIGAGLLATSVLLAASKGKGGGGDSGWKNGFTCPRCGCAEAWKTKEVKYKCKKCGYKMSVTAGTIFQDSHTPLEKWFAAIDLINTSNGKITASSLQNKLKLGSNRTAQRMIHLIKRVLVKTQIRKYRRAPAEMLNLPVEIDVIPIVITREHFFVIIAVEKLGNRTGRIRIKQTDNRPQEFADFIRNTIKVNTSQNEQKKTGIICPRILPSEIREEYNQLIKNARYAYTASKNVSSKFKKYISEHYHGNFDACCKNFCVTQNAKFTSVSREEILETMLK